MLTVDVLKEFGADTSEGLARCMNKEEFYLKMVGKCLENERFGKLKGVLEANDTKEAFELCHALKGAVGNLALTPIFEPLSELTELLREEKPGDYMGLYEETMEQKNKLESMIG